MSPTRGQERIPPAQASRTPGRKKQESRMPNRALKSRLKIWALILALALLAQYPTLANQVPGLSLPDRPSPAIPPLTDGMEVPDISALWANGQTAPAETSLSSTPLPLAHDWLYQGTGSFSHLGTSIASAGDVNGDGYDDILVGDPLYFNGTTMEGRVHVFYGSASGLSATPSWSAQSTSDGLLGWSVASAGDINGDGYADIIVGEPGYNNGQGNEGRFHIYLGSASGLGATPAQTIDGNTPGAQLGWSVASAGDVNGNGLGDVIVGAPFAGNGKAFLFTGSAGGLNTTPAWSVEGSTTNASLGYAVAAAGDVNNDGYGDVIVGGDGEAHVYHGSPSGLSTSAAWSVISDFESFGSAVSTAGDVNGDGFDDVIIGAPYSGRGRALVYLGSASGLASTPAWSVQGAPGDSLFGYSVASGDLNGNGYGDIIVSSRRQAAIYHGAAAGLRSSPAWLVEIDPLGVSQSCIVASAGNVNGDAYDDFLVSLPWARQVQGYHGFRRYLLTSILKLGSGPTGLSILAEQSWHLADTWAQTVTAPASLYIGNQTYVFDRWYVDGEPETADNPYPVLMNGPRTAIAQYNASP